MRVDHARQHKNARHGETLPDIPLRFGTRQCDAILQIQLVDLRVQFVFERAFTNDLALE